MRVALCNEVLAELRQDASRYATEPELQLLLAEAECRSGNNAECIAATDRTLGLAPQSSPALAWKGLALARQATVAMARRYFHVIPPPFSAVLCSA